MFDRFGLGVWSSVLGKVLRRWIWPGNRGLHSCTFRLNVSTLRGIGGAFRGLLGGVRGCLRV